MQRLVAVTATCVALTAIAGCSDPAGPSGTPGSVSITAPVTELELGASVQLSVTVLNQTGGTMTNQHITWSSSHPAVASVTMGGRVTGHSPGVANIVARSGNVADTVQIRTLAPFCTTAMTAGSIAPGASVSGSLDPADCTLPHGVAGDGYRLTLAADTVLTGTLTGFGFDALLVITDLNLNIVAFADDTPAGTDPVLLARLPAGTYVVWATGYSESETGDYVLELHYANTGSCENPGGTIQLGTNATGALTPSDCLMPDMRSADLWDLVIPGATRVVIEMRSTMFDAYLLLADAAGTYIAQDDDGAGNLNARIDLELQPGTYTVWATSYNPQEYGDYQLSTSAAGAVAGSAMRPPEIAPGKTGSVDRDWSLPAKTDLRR